MVHNFNIQHIFISNYTYITLKHIKQGIQWLQQVGHMTYVIRPVQIVNLIEKCKTHAFNKANTVITVTTVFFCCSYCSLGQVE